MIRFSLKLAIFWVVSGSFALQGNPEQSLYYSLDPLSVAETLAFMSFIPILLLEKKPLRERVPL